jgi:hypothetical protein
MERAGTARVVRSGATCFVGRGDGMGGRRLLGTDRVWVERAGVEVRARRTGVRLRAVLEVLAVAREVFLVAAFFLTVFAADWAFPLVERFEALRDDDRAAVARRVERTEPFVFFRDAAAFNCFPLFGLWSRRLSRTPRKSPGPPFKESF